MHDLAGARRSNLLTGPAIDVIGAVVAQLAAVQAEHPNCHPSWFAAPGRRRPRVRATPRRRRRCTLGRASPGTTSSPSRATGGPPRATDPPYSAEPDQTPALRLRRGRHGAGQARPPLAGRGQPSGRSVHIAEDERFVVCYNPEAADRDAALRQVMLAKLEKLVAAPARCPT